MRFAILVLLITSVSTAMSEAQLFYRFVEKEESQVLAVLELSELPARTNEFVGLTFTDIGQEIFGLGPVYTGTFDSMIFEHGNFIQDKFSVGGLAGGDAFGSEFVKMADFDPPSSSRFLSPIVRFDIQASAFEQDDYIRIIGEMDVRITRSGTWQAVPEPNALPWALLPLMAFTVMRRRRRRRRRRQPIRYLTPFRLA